MTDETRRDRADDDKLSEEPKQPESEERKAKKKNLKDLDITDEAGGALKGGVPKIPDAPFE